VLGPIFVLKLKYAPVGFSRKLVAEMWLYPDDRRILELSTKCAPVEAFQVAAESRAYLGERGVDLGGEQQTKTRTALEYFSKRLGEADAAAPAPAPKKNDSVPAGAPKTDGVAPAEVAATE